MTKSNIEQMSDANVLFCEHCGELVSVDDMDEDAVNETCPHCGKETAFLYVVIDACIPPGMQKDMTVSIKPRERRHIMTQFDDVFEYSGNVPDRLKKMFRWVMTNKKPITDRSNDVIIVMLPKNGE